VHQLEVLNLGSSNLPRGIIGHVAELVRALVSKTKSWEFESPHGYFELGLWRNWQMQQV
jgi:hypothetical protein